MPNDKLCNPLSFEADEDKASNTSSNQTFGDIVAERLSRRDLVRGALAVTSISTAVAPAALLGACSNAVPTTPSFRFDELGAGSDTDHHVASGYDADVLIRWGDAVLDDAPKFDPGEQTAAAQATQFGYNNDFVGYLPIEGSSNHGLLVINHEFTNEQLMFPQNKDDDGKRPTEVKPNLIDVEMMAHGGSVIEVARKDGIWVRVEGSKFARRITAETEMRISGPAAGNDLMKTKADPSGTRVRGMLNNCAGATTPWGTWLTCEENFNGYFSNAKAASKLPNAAAFERYGIPREWYRWADRHDRFDIGKEPNEANRFGWVVEIDPWDPQSVPVKRTALGRFKHEGAGNIVNRDGRFVVYQGDDQRFDYIYRFVTRDKVDLENPAANRDILDSGSLYVARFDADGSGVWLPLEFGTGPLTPASGFRDQGDVVIHARLAADLLGATKMDRPEDIEANPVTGKVYCMLTNNTERTDASVDAANPRANNAFGHIIEIEPAGGDHTAPNFSWNILLKCGDPQIASVGATFNADTTSDGWFGMPDNCVIDSEGRLWIATDGNSAQKTGRNDGLWAVETEGKARATSKLFYRVPVGAELCGPCVTPDTRTFFVAVQHPGAPTSRTDHSTYANPSTRWPDFDTKLPPRPSIVAITRSGGGKIGG